MQQSVDGIKAHLLFGGAHISLQEHNVIPQATPAQTAAWILVCIFIHQNNLQKHPGVKTWLIKNFYSNPQITKGIKFYKYLHAQGAILFLIGVELFLIILSMFPLVLKKQVSNMVLISLITCSFE